MPVTGVSLLDYSQQGAEYGHSKVCVCVCGVGLHYNHVNDKHVDGDNPVMLCFIYEESLLYGNVLTVLETGTGALLWTLTDLNTV